MTQQNISRSGIIRTSYFGFDERSNRNEEANNLGWMTNEVADQLREFKERKFLHPTGLRFIGGL